MKIINQINFTNNKKQNPSFKSAFIIQYNDTYSPIKTKLTKELSKFSNGDNNASVLGAGKFGETYRFKDAELRNVVIKKSKGEYKDNYSQEYNNLIQVPSEKVGGQVGIARAYNPTTNEYYLLSTMAEGKEISPFNRFTDSHLKSLFKKMFELDKVGLYHGDLNGKNILLTRSGEINFIDYQWSQIISKTNFFDTTKSKKLLLPVSNFPENAQMFEMATMPYYLQSIGSQKEKEDFLKMYLKNKANYHNERYMLIKKLAQNWPYSAERYSINKSLEAELAKSKVYKNPSDNLLKIELKKFQFLSDYRDAFGHVDEHMLDRNILTSSSSYICSISAVQDFRKEIAKQLRTCYDHDMINYLKAQMEYGDYWYNNLREFSTDTFAYVMRAITKQMDIGEEQHKFYDYDRNPRLMTANKNILDAMDTRFHAKYDRNFEVPYDIKTDMHEIYSEPMDDIRSYSHMSKDLKAYHRRKKVQHAYGELKTFEKQGKVLDLLNTSEVMTLKVREFLGYAIHNIYSSKLNRLLNTMLENSVNFTERLHNTILQGLSEIDANKILVQGYSNMRNFITKV